MNWMIELMMNPLCVASDLALSHLRGETDADTIEEFAEEGVDDIGTDEDEN